MLDAGVPLGYVLGMVRKRTNQKAGRPDRMRPSIDPLIADELWDIQLALPGASDTNDVIQHLLLQFIRGGDSFRARIRALQGI